MSNKIQISCNNNNKEIVVTLKRAWSRIARNTESLINAEAEENRLLEEVLKMRKIGHPKTALYMLKYQKLKDKIEYFKKEIEDDRRWIRICSRELRIC